MPHPIRIRDYSNFTLAAALMAGAYGFPYLPVCSVLGSDILEFNPEFKQASNPFAASREPIVLVPPLKTPMSPSWPFNGPTEPAIAIFGAVQA